MFNTRTNKIAYFIETDTMYSEATLRPEIVSRWLSLDPLARKYPGMSPYNFVANTPLNAIDPDGQDVVFLIDKEGAGGNGHMAMLFQDKTGNWLYFSQGAAEDGSQLGFLSNSDYRGGVEILRMQRTTSSGEIIQMTKKEALDAVTGGKYDNSITLVTTPEQDGMITSNALKLQADFASAKEKYNVYSNNCVDACQDAVEGTKGTSTGIHLPKDNNPKPNAYFEQLESSVPWINGEVKMESIPSGLDNYPAQNVVVPNLREDGTD